MCAPRSRASLTGLGDRSIYAPVKVAHGWTKRWRGASLVIQNVDYDDRGRIGTRQRAGAFERELAIGGAMQLVFRTHRWPPHDAQAAAFVEPRNDR